MFRDVQGLWTSPELQVDQISRIHSNAPDFVLTGPSKVEPEVCFAQLGDLLKGQGSLIHIDSVCSV